MLATINLSRWVVRSAFRVFVHSPAHMRELIEAAGFRRHASHDTPFWQVTVFECAAGD
jgi:hypothetical protein